jgi:hypothetical protein
MLSSGYPLTSTPALPRLGDRQQLPHRAPNQHGHAQGLGLLETQHHVLVQQSGRETEIERARQNSFWELVLCSAVAPASGIDDVDHDLRIEAGLDAHHDRFGRDRERRRRQQIVGELHRLPHAWALADEEHLAEHLEYRAKPVSQVARAGNHDSESPLLRTADASAHR